jgi:hypothetical protein
MSASKNAFGSARAAVADENAGKTILVHADPGTGVRGALVDVLAQVAARRAVLIVTTRMVLLEQWRELLRDADAGVPVGRFDTQMALEMAPRDAPPAGPGVYLATIQQLGQRRGLASLINARFHLVVFDDLPQVVGRLAAGVEELTRSYDRTLVVGSFVAAVPWPEPTHHIRVSYDNTASEPAEILMVTTEVTDVERDLERRARELLTAFKGNASYPNRSQLHSALIREITRVQTGEVSAEPTPPVLDEAWQLVDELESLGPDPMVASLRESVSRCVGEGLVFVVTSHLLADAQYVLSALADAGYRAELFPPRDRSDDAARIAEPATGDVVVVTPAGVDLLDRWPDRSSVVLWHTPQTGGPAAQRLLRFVATARRVVILDSRTDAVDGIIRDLRQLDQDRQADLEPRDQT